MNNNKKYMVMTFGCQMSENDGQKIAGLLEKMDYRVTDDVNEADVVVFNTCCVREHAEEKTLSKLGGLKSLKQKNPNMIIAFGGCMAQQQHIVDRLKKSYSFVDIIFGTHNFYKLPELIAKANATTGTIVDVWQIDGEVIEGLPISRTDKLKATVSIMYGCNNFCTYCIVPYVRGRERSRKMEDIVSEVKGLVSGGYKEITLLGQNVNSYGLDIYGKDSFAKLLKEVDNIEGDFRIRFMTSHPKDMTDELIKTIAESKKVCEQVHLPFQSGSTEVLRKMNRKYTKEQYLDLIEKVKSNIPNVALSTDIIVGFPGETDENFEDTVDVVRKVKYDQAFTFIYSKRVGTPAAKMEEQIDDETKKSRMMKLLDTYQSLLNERNESLIGNVEEVLVEGINKNLPEYLTGKTRTSRVINFKGDEKMIGNFVNIKITENHLWYFVGEVVE